MKIIHGTWIPNTANDSFIQGGSFYLWVEIAEKRRRQSQVYPYQLNKEEFANLLKTELGFVESYYQPLVKQIKPQYFLLPSLDNQPLPSLELSRYLEIEITENCDLQYWEIDCFPVANLFKDLRDLHFFTSYNPTEIQLGEDLLFWYYYSQVLRQIILKDHYIPALKYREIIADKRKKNNKSFELYPLWELISPQYENNLQEYQESMPLACVCGFENPQETLTFYESESLLRHFSEYWLNYTINQTPNTATFDKKIGDDSDSLLYNCLHHLGQNLLLRHDQAQLLSQYQQWQNWKQQIIPSGKANNFYLGFQLEELEEEDNDHWFLHFILISRQDLSLQVQLFDYWYSGEEKQVSFQQYFGEDLEKELLLNLGYAARIYPKIWSGLETQHPIGVKLNLAETFDFLTEKSWILEDAGYKVIIPAWWTPQGRQKAKIRLKTSSNSKKSPASVKGKGYFSLPNLIKYRYELSIGEQTVTETEWLELVNAKTPLIKFRGQWVELDQSQMQKMLDFWQNHQQENPEISLIELLKKSTEESDTLEVEADEFLADLMAKLKDYKRLEEVDNPPHFQGELRGYQKRGVSWLKFLEQLGLNGCLADDMGLGKTVQVIAVLLMEKLAYGELENQDNLPFPTLLIAPTSVVGNWDKEVEKFAPRLKVLIHHGSTRKQNLEEFQAQIKNYDLVITSFTLARKDEKLFKSLTWQRIILDEAQNIKNPKSAQTKAILQMKSHYRLALTGTPIENRLLDLWSIFNFLNPGYLGKESQFRKQFELPIQKENNHKQAIILKKLVEPFILRRVKTDKDIIKDLPDKMEHKQYCNLTKEQASLYEAVVKDVEKQLEEVEGIKRRGLILATLMKLKQICNHPRQFLQDNSEFTPQRSHKLERLGEMIEEVILEGESLLIFTQFTEIGEALQNYFKTHLHYHTYYLHGGTNRKKREQMICEFQDPQTDASIFILSLKAGGVGITLTKANHVFHFDRWWNPAVENQATDRAFRIGQKKNVFVHKFVTLGTLEEKIDQMLEDKQKIADSVVGSDESWLTELDNDSFKKLIALNRQTIM
jgi:SNF2 family DNA or RNA helicase